VTGRLKKVPFRDTSARRPLLARARYDHLLAASGTASFCRAKPSADLASIRRDLGGTEVSCRGCGERLTPCFLLRPFFAALTTSSTVSPFSEHVGQRAALAECGDAPALSGCGARTSC
jgi:hypothetical protein